MLAAQNPVFTAKCDSDENLKEEEIACCNVIESVKQKLWRLSVKLLPTISMVKK